MHHLITCYDHSNIRKDIDGLTLSFSDRFLSVVNILSSIMFRFNIKAWSMLAMLNHVCSLHNSH